MTVANALKRFRAQFGLSQKEVAEKVGMGATSYYRYETGKFSPQADVLIKLADAYNVSVDYLLGRTDEPRPRTTDPSWTGEMVDCRDALWQILGKVDRIIGGSTYGYLQNHEPAQRQTVHRADTATA